MTIEAVFIDRDGVINKNIDGDYIRRWPEFKFLPGSLTALKSLSRLGVKIIIISNQAGLNKGLIKKKDFAETNRKMKEVFKKNKIQIKGIFYCPHMPEENCSCRKPKTGLLKKAQKKFKLNLKKSVLIGDALSDIETGKNAGCWANILVLSGRTKKMQLTQLKNSFLKPNYIFKNLLEVVKYLKTMITVKR